MSRRWVYLCHSNEPEEDFLHPSRTFEQKMIEFGMGSTVGWHGRQRILEFLTAAGLVPSRTVDPYPKSVLYKGFSRVGCASVMIMFCMSSSLCLKRLSMNSLSKAKIYSPLHFICRILFQCLIVYHRHNIFNQYNRLTSIGLWCVEKTSTSNAHACHQLLSRTIAKQFSVTL